MMTQRLVIFSLASAILMAVGCGEATQSDTGQKPMSESQTIASRPLCVGRFLIDVPVDVQVVGTQTTTSSTAGAVSIERAVTKAAFVAKMEDIKAKLQSAPHHTEGTRLSEQLRPDDATYIFRYRKNSAGTRAYQIDGYRWVESNMFTINSSAANDSFLSTIADVKRGLSTMTPRDTWSIPTEPGFCFDNGFLPGRENSFEATGVQLSFEAYPGVSIFMETRTRSFSAEKEAGLIERTDWAMTLMDASDKPIVLRRRQDRPVLSGLAEEVLWKHKRDGYYQLKGDAEMNGQAGDPGKPDTAFSIILDQPGDGSLQPNEEKVIQLWDAVINSVRLRPGAL